MTADEYKAARKKAGLTMEQMAARVGVTYATIWRRENGTRGISEEAATAQTAAIAREEDR